jgi:hypothetical protein
MTQLFLRAVLQLSFICDCKILAKMELHMHARHSLEQTIQTAMRELEFEKWAASMRIPPRTLKEAVASVGVSPRRIREYLRLQSVSGLDGLDQQRHRVVESSRRRMVRGG